MLTHNVDSGSLWNLFWKKTLFLPSSYIFWWNQNLWNRLHMLQDSLGRSIIYIVILKGDPFILYECIEYTAAERSNKTIMEKLNLSKKGLIQIFVVFASLEEAKTWKTHHLLNEPWSWKHILYLCKFWQLLMCTFLKTSDT